jgi:prenyltransferase beta subunit
VSLRLEQIQVSRLSVPVLDESVPLVGDFLLSLQKPDGGFRDREGNSDLYYSVFAIDSLCSLQRDLPLETLVPWLLSFQNFTALDFVHLCCLARCLSAVDQATPNALFAQIETFRSDDGGYNPRRESKEGTVYGCFLAYGAYSDHNRKPPNAIALTICLDSLRTADGAWANDSRMTVGSTPATAAAIAVCRNLRHPFDSEAASNWLLQQVHPEGGFIPAPKAPMPDLLSTAVALHALDSIQTDLAPIKEHMLDYVDTLWSAEGGFHGHWAEDILDAEYTFYGLLALGHLSL